MNLFEVPEHLPDAELFEQLLTASDLKIERIISKGQVTPAGNWYDQDWDEWVVVLAGEAKLLLEHETEPRNLSQGDSLFLPAHLKHRVEWTSSDPATIWLAIHFNHKSGTKDDG